MAETYVVPASVTGTIGTVDYSIKKGTYVSDEVEPETAEALAYLALNTDLVTGGPKPADPDPEPKPKPTRARASKTEE